MVKAVPIAIGTAHVALRSRRRVSQVLSASTIRQIAPGRTWPRSTSRIPGMGRPLLLLGGLNGDDQLDVISDAAGHGGDAVVVAVDGEGGFPARAGGASARVFAQAGHLDVGGD